MPTESSRAAVAADEWPGRVILGLGIHIAATLGRHSDGASAVAPRRPEET